MITLKTALQTRSLRLPLRKALATAGELGAEGVQIDLRTELPLADCSRSALREIRKLLDDHRLGVASVAFPTRRSYADPAELDRRIAATQQAMSVGAGLGARVLVGRVGPIPEPTILRTTGDDEQHEEPNPAYEQLVASLTALALHGERVGARLAAITGPDEVASLLALLTRVPDGTVGVDFQPAELVRQGESPTEALSQLGPHVLHVTAADAVHDFSQRQVVDVPLGRGTVDVPALLASLEQCDYHGWLTVERHDSPDPKSELGDAIAYLRNVQRDR